MPDTNGIRNPTQANPPHRGHVNFTGDHKKHGESVGTTRMATNGGAGKRGAGLWGIGNPFWTGVTSTSVMG